MGDELSLLTAWWLVETRWFYTYMISPSRLFKE